MEKMSNNTSKELEKFLNEPFLPTKSKSKDYMKGVNPLDFDSIEDYEAFEASVKMGSDKHSDGIDGHYNVYDVTSEMYDIIHKYSRWRPDFKKLTKKDDFLCNNYTTCLDQFLNEFLDKVHNWRCVEFIGYNHLDEEIYINNNCKNDDIIDEWNSWQDDLIFEFSD